MNSSEKKAVSSVAALYMFRMLGLFMVLPVLPLYASELDHASPLMIGIALGIYGFSQALLQIPFGFLSDRFGRKKLIALGLMLFILGSVIAAVSDSIHGIIVGRLLQGSGAIASTMMALLSDLTRVEQRTKAMAVLGMTIGMSFLLAMVLGPMINAYAGLSGIFWTTAGMGCVGMILLFVLVSEPRHLSSDRNAGFVNEDFVKVLFTPGLLRLDLGIFLLHFNLVAGFSGFPLLLAESAIVDTGQHSLVYGAVMLVSFLCMMPLMSLSDKQRWTKWVLLASVALLAVSHLLLSTLDGYGLLLALLLFFIPFNLLEVVLPSSISKLAPAGTRGTAMGVYSTMQFLGAATGGFVGGAILQMWDLSVLFEINALVCVFWAISFVSMTEPKFLTSRVVNLGINGAAGANRLMEGLSSHNGVEEVVIVQNVAYLKVDEQRFDEDSMNSLIGKH